MGVLVNEFGEVGLDASLLASEGQSHEAHHAHSSETNALMQGGIDFPLEGFIRKNNEQDGYTSSGWIFESRFIFDRAKLLVLFSGLTVDRLK